MLMFLRVVDDDDAAAAVVKVIGIMTAATIKAFMTLNGVVTF